MKAYYQVTITKESVGSAVRHKEPPLEGTPIIKVMETATAGDHKIIVMECSEQEHRFNLARPGVVELEAAAADKLAAEYQPKHVETELNPRTHKAEQTKVPAFDLGGFIKRYEKGGRSRNEDKGEEEETSGRADAGKERARSGRRRARSNRDAARDK